MAKFCGNCGAQSDDYAAVCGNCGAPFAAAPASSNPVDKVKGIFAGKSIGKLVTMGVAALLVIVLLFVGIGALLPSPEKTAEKYLKAVLKENFDKTEKYFSQIYIDYLADYKSDLKKNNENDYDEMAKYYNLSVSEVAEDLYDKMDKGHFDPVVSSGYKTSVDIISCTVYDKNTDVFDDVLDSVEDEEDFDADGDKIKKVAIARYEVTAKNGKEVAVYEGSLTLIKEGGSWKILGSTGDVKRSEY